MLEQYISHLIFAWCTHVQSKPCACKAHNIGMVYDYSVRHVEHVEACRGMNGSVLLSSLQTLAGCYSLWPSTELAWHSNLTITDISLHSACLLPTLP